MALPRARRSGSARALVPVLGLLLLTACGAAPEALAPAAAPSASGTAPAGPLLTGPPPTATPLTGRPSTAAVPTGASGATSGDRSPVAGPVTVPPDRDPSPGGASPTGASAGATGAGGTAAAGGASAGSSPDAAPPAAAADPGGAGGADGADVGEPVLHAITCDQTEAQVAASGAPRVTRGDATVYIGTEQVGGDDQAPRVVRFDGGARTWCRDDLERSGDDGRGYGLLWSGDVLLGVFSAVGDQGDPAGDLRRFTGSGWLRSYADASPRGGGGAKTAVLVALDPGTGAGIPGRGTWITADNGGKVNSATVTDLALDGDGVRVTVTSAFAPRRADRSAAECSGSSPFTADYTFDGSLGSVTAVALDPRCT
jgi:hypothetical protein